MEVISGFSGARRYRRKSYRFAVAATREPDADSDGYGDTTRNQCPIDAITQGAGRVVAPTPTPTPTPSAAAAPLPDINVGCATDGRIQQLRLEASNAAPGSLE